MSFSTLTWAYWCVLIAAALPYLSAYIGKAGSFRGRDNQQPRDWAARQSGWRARALAAQNNGFEGLPIFIGAVIVAHQLGAQQARLDLFASAYIALRCIYIGLYIGNISTARSAVWALGWLVSLAIFFITP